MANDFKSNHSLENTIAIGMITAVIFLTVIAIKPGLLPRVSRSTPMAIQTNSSPSSGYQPEILPFPTDVPNLTTSMGLPTNTPISTIAPTFTPTYMFLSQPLPDLIVAGISAPVCATEYEGTKLRFSIFVRNIGRARTRSFGAFDTDVFLILGQRRYSLGEWAEQFDGVVGSSVTKIFNLNPNDDIKFTVVIDIKGNKNFSIEVTANSGTNPIPEANTTNNTLIKSFSSNCY